MAVHIRRNDVVVVITGAHRGAQGKVLRVDPKKNLVVVEGVNLVYRHVRPTRRNPQGGRLQKEAPIHMSNVLPLDSGLGKRGRTHFVVERDATGRVVTKQRVTTGGTVLHSLTRRETSPSNASGNTSGVTQ